MQANAAGPLDSVLITTADLPTALQFYSDGLAMEVCAADSLDAPATTILRSHYGLPGDGRLQLAVLARPGVAGNPKLVLIAVPDATPPARPGHDSRLHGPLSLGFAVREIERREATMGALGWPARAGVTVLRLADGAGGHYDVKETHYCAPDGVLVLAIDRGNMASVAPLDAQTDTGGPAYVGMMVADAQRSGEFLHSVLGLELRREVLMQSSGPDGGMALPTGTEFLFQQWFSPGTTTGYVILMQLMAGALRPEHPPGPASRGQAAWSFPVADVELVHARAHRSARLGDPITLARPAGGAARTCVLTMPEGFRIEVFQPA
jgi:catechol 2,3-dioxygenase-like lactoylglutathione lyase family enzyme